MERNEKNPTTNPEKTTPVDPNETPQQREQRLKREKEQKGDVENPSTDEPRREGDQKFNR